VIGAYSEKNHDAPIDPARRPFISEPPFRNACFSLAALDNLRRISIFSNDELGFCMGMLLEYKNGAQRSLGQCRIDVDPVKSYTKPLRICLRRRRYYQAGISVKLQATTVQIVEKDECEHSRVGDEERWTCFPMCGALEFWFSDRETRLAVIVD